MSYLHYQILGQGTKTFIQDINIKGANTNLLFPDPILAGVGPTGNAKTRDTRFGVNTLMALDPLYAYGYIRSNTAFGWGVLKNTMGAENTGIGSEVLPLFVGGAQNTGVGYNIFANLDRGTGNIGIGAVIGNGIIYGYNNILLGRSIMTQNTDNAYYNIAIGGHALRENISTANIAIGEHSSFNNSTGYYNVNIGHYTGGNNSTGVENTNVGAYASFQGTTISSVTSFGAYALYDNQASNNAAFGAKALYSNTTGEKSVAVGSRAGYFITTGTKLVLVGQLAAGNATTASYMVGIGQEYRRQSIETEYTIRFWIVNFYG